MTGKQFEVIKAVTGKVNVSLDGKEMPFGKYGVFRVKDPGKANAIRQKYGRNVTVTGVSTTPHAERGLHSNRIVSPGMPWHKYDQLGRIIGKKENDGDTVPNRKKDNRKKSKTTQAI